VAASRARANREPACFGGSKWDCARSVRARTSPGNRDALEGLSGNGRTNSQLGILQRAEGSGIPIGYAAACGRKCRSSRTGRTPNGRSSTRSQRRAFPLSPLSRLAALPLSRAAEPLRRIGLRAHSRGSAFCFAFAARWSLPRSRPRRVRVASASRLRHVCATSASRLRVAAVIRRARSCCRSSSRASRRRSPATAPHRRWDRAHPATTAAALGSGSASCARTGLTPATSVPGLGSPCHICARTGLAPATSAPGLGSLLPHLRQDWARSCHICARTGLAPATSAPGLGSLLPHAAPNRGWGRPGFPSSAHRRGSHSITRSGFAAADPRRTAGRRTNTDPSKITNKQTRIKQNSKQANKQTNEQSATRGPSRTRAVVRAAAPGPPKP
jgi:hypothetical protein